jgi:hypothetical protein
MPTITSFVDGAISGVYSITNATLDQVKALIQHPEAYVQGEDGNVTVLTFAYSADDIIQGLVDQGVIQVADGVETSRFLAF